MASLPQQASQRRRSSINLSSDASASASASEEDKAQNSPQARDIAASTEDEKSPSLQVAIPIGSNSDPATANASASNEDPSADPTTPKLDPRHCWICLQDEDEEGSDNSAWRSPCPCNLQAHEGCMLEWIGDLEAPKSRRGKPPSKILCPQCKAEIQVERPRDIIVSAVDLVNNTARAFILPAGLGALFGCLYSGSLVYGLNSLYLVFGSEYAETLIRQHSRDISIIQQLVGNRAYRFILRLTEYTDPFMPMSNFLSTEMFIGLPMVAPALILSRTRIADYIFALLPVPLFALPLALSPENRNIRRWPPSPDLAIAALPYIRTAYNELYRFAFGDLVKKWDQAVMRKPREGETIEQIAQEQNENNGEGGLGLPVGVDMELVVELGIVEDGEEEPDQQDPLDAPADAQPANPGAEQPAQVDVEANANANANDEAEQQEQQQQHPNGAPGLRANEEIQLGGRDIYPLDIASTVMGALFFPAISSLIGNILQHTLPQKWVMKPFVSDSIYSLTKTKTRTLPATGLLQEKWGRSIVGGCLFVVLKDALVLYVKWKRARDHGKRKVLDYPQQTK